MLADLILLGSGLDLLLETGIAMLSADPTAAAVIPLGLVLAVVTASPARCGVVAADAKKGG